MSRIICEICDDPRPTVYEPKNEGHYCVSCHEKYISQSICDCDGTCPMCEGEL